MNFHRYFFLFLRHSWVIVLLTAASVAGSYAWVKRQTPVYASRATIEVEVDPAKVINIEDVKDNRMASLDAINTTVQTLTSNSVMIEVAGKIGLTDEWAKNDPSGKLPASMQSALAGTIRNKVNVSLRRGTRLIDVVAEDPDPAMAQSIARHVVEEYLAMRQLDRNKISGDANSFLSRQTKELKEKMEKSDNALAQYRLDNNEVSLLEKDNVVSKNLDDLNNKSLQARTERSRIETDLAALKKVDPSDLARMLELPSVAALPQVAELRNQVTSSEVAFAALKERYLELHPKDTEALSKLNDYRSKLSAAVANAGDVLHQILLTAQENEQKINVMLAEQKQKSLELEKIAIPYNVLKREAETNRALYDEVFSRLKETDVTQQLARVPYRVVEDPLLSPVPIRPDPPKSMLTAGLVGLAAAIGLILLLDRMDSSIRTVDEAESELGLPVLGAIPQGDEKNSSPAVVVDDAGSSQAEGFRTLRASISLLGDESQRRVLLVTSAVPAEGKTFTSVNLAAALAGQGLRTLLIDSDLRRPALSATLMNREDRKDEDYRGLTDVLSGLTDPWNAIRGTRVEGLWLLPSGRRAPNPSELLSMKSVPELLDQLSSQFDRIVIDSAPINAVADTLAIASYSHAVCLVLRYGKTPRRAALRAITLLQKAGARMAGIVMNRMPSRRGAYYYYYYYGDPYVKDSVYGASEAKTSRRRSGETKRASAAEPEA